MDYQGTVVSADMPDTPLEGVTVSCPAFNASTTTDASGHFDLGQHLAGTYDFTASYDPPGSNGYHNRTFTGIVMDQDTGSLEFSLYQVLPPQGLSATSGDGSVSLMWSEPSNQGAASASVASLQTQVQATEAMLTHLRGSGGVSPRTEKYRKIQQHLAVMRSHLHAAQERGTNNELDELSDLDHPAG